MGRIINAVIFAVTLLVFIRLFYWDGKWALANIRKPLRYFTVQSNLLCGVAALLMVLWPDEHWAWLVKYVGTAAVTVTMLTVFLFLGPSMGSVWPLLRGRDFFMHLTTPIMAILSFLVYERRGMTLGEALLGMAPLVLYGICYLYKVVFAPEGERWEDFYGFNKGGKWPIAFTVMMLGGLGVCLGLMALQNL